MLAIENNLTKLINLYWVEDIKKTLKDENFIKDLKIELDKKNIDKNNIIDNIVNKNNYSSIKNKCSIDLAYLEITKSSMYKDKLWNIVYTKACKPCEIDLIRRKRNHVIDKMIRKWNPLWIDVDWNIIKISYSRIEKERRKIEEKKKYDEKIKKILNSN